MSTGRFPGLRGGVVATVLALVAAGCFGDDAPVVQTERVRSGAVTQTVSAPARVEAAARQDVAAATSGVVVALDGVDGDRVEAGDVVVRLESSQVELAQQQAEAARAAASSFDDIAVDGAGAATLASVEQAVAELDATMQPRIAESRAEVARLPVLLGNGAATAVDAVEASYLTNRAALLAAGEAIAAQQDAAARSLTDALNQAVAQATSAQRAQAEAAAAAAAAQADELEVAAPLDGVLALGEAAASDGAGLALDPLALGGAQLPDELAGAASGLGGLGGDGGAGTLRVGAPVVAGQTLFTVYDLSAVYVGADVDEVDAPLVAPGQRATVLIDAFADREFPGVVERVAVEAARTAAGGVGFPTRVRLLDDADDALPGLGLRVGMTASAEIAVATEASDLVVPSRALLRRDRDGAGAAGSSVFVVRDGAAALVPVEVVVLGEDAAAVEGDLDPGERVVVSGYEDLADGDEVRARGADG